MITYTSIDNLSPNLGWGFQEIDNIGIIEHNQIDEGYVSFQKKSKFIKNNRNFYVKTSHPYIESLK